MPKFRVTGGGKRFMFHCPGCDQIHGINDTWEFTGGHHNPTISPSILVTGFVEPTEEEYARIVAGEKIERIPQICHSFIRNGKIEFLTDCTHKLAGRTVDLPDWPHEF